MLNVNEYKLIPLSELVHDEALFESYCDFVETVAEIYEIENLGMQGEIVLGEGYVCEDTVLQQETRFWNKQAMRPSAEGFLLWSKSKAGYWSMCDDPNSTYKVETNILIKHGEPKVLGRSNLYSDLKGGVRIGMGFDCVHPDLRGQGLGRVILAHRIAQAAECGVNKMKLNIAQDNMASLRRLWKLNAGGLVQNVELENPRAEITRDREVAWINPQTNLDRIYDVLTTPLQRTPEPMEYYFEPC